MSVRQGDSYWTGLLLLSFRGSVLSSSQMEAPAPCEEPTYLLSPSLTTPISHPFFSTVQAISTLPSAVASLPVLAAFFTLTLASAVS